MHNSHSGLRALGMGPIALLLAMAAIPISTSAQTAPPNSTINPAPDDYAVLAARSQGLTVDQKGQAAGLFFTAFKLWQSGEFAAAELAFRQGLDIDPANAVANYYYGDCLQRRHDFKGARIHFQRAVTFGNGVAEGFKAQAALLALASAPKDVADMTPDEIQNAFLGHWAIKWFASDGNEYDGFFDISKDSKDIFQISGGPSLGNFSKIIISGNKFDLHVPTFIGHGNVIGNLTTSHHMDGIYKQDGGRITADKQ